MAASGAALDTIDKLEDERVSSDAAALCTFFREQLARISEEAESRLDRHEVPGARIAEAANSEFPDPNMQGMPEDQNAWHSSTRPFCTHDPYTRAVVGPELPEGQSHRSRHPFWTYEQYVAGLRDLFKFLDCPEELSRAQVLGRRIAGEAPQGEDGSGSWEAICQYIVDFWVRSTRYIPYRCSTGKGRTIELPYPFLTPSGQFDPDTFELKGWFSEMYRWDTYFQAAGLLISGGVELAKMQYLNLTYMYRTRGHIFNASLEEFSTHSQPPLEAEGVMKILRSHPEEVGEWSDLVMDALYDEIFSEWLNPEDKGHHRLDTETIARSGLLTRHGSLHFSASMVGSESGVDHDSLTQNYGEDLVPVALNAQVARQLLELGNYYEIRGNRERAQVCWQLYEQIKKAMNEHMWVGSGEAKGYRCLNYDRKKDAIEVIPYRRLTDEVFALWSRIPDPEQAEILRQNILGYLGDQGLSATHPDDARAAYERGKLGHLQWEYPNAWPPLVQIAVEGLLNYGFLSEARQIASVWVGTLEKEFAKGENKGFKEKYACDSTVAMNPGYYGVEDGFGWTIGTYLWMKKFLNGSKDGEVDQAIMAALGMQTEQRSAI